MSYCKFCMRYGNCPITNPSECPQNKIEKLMVKLALVSPDIVSDYLGGAITSPSAHLDIPQLVINLN